MLALLACVVIAPSQPPSEDVVKRLVTALSDSDPDVRQHLASALAKIGSGSIAPLTAALKDSNADRRAGAAYALGLIGEASKAAMPNLLDLLDDANLDVRRQASYAVSRIVRSER